MVKLATEVLKYRDESYDYRREDTSWGVHGIHPYPAMMVYPIARRLIKEFSQNGDRILDPFMGSGTVLVESLLHHRQSFGADINPLAILLAQVKTTYLPPKRLYDTFNQLLAKANNLNYFVPNFFNISFWFHDYVIEDLAKLKAKIDSISDEEVRKFFLIAFSETVRLCSNTKNSEFKLFRIKNLDNYQPNVFATFEKIATRNISKLLQTYPRKPEGITKTFLQDSRNPMNTLPPNSINLVLTSPPYGDSKTTVAYGQFSRLSLQWLGYGSVTVDKDSLGGNNSISLEHTLSSDTFTNIIARIAEIDSKRANQVLSFNIDLFAVLKNITRYLLKGGYMCLVVGNRRVKGITLPTDSIIIELTRDLGYKHLRTITREIPNKRMPRVNSPTNITGAIETTINEENIIILCKETN